MNPSRFERIRRAGARAELPGWRLVTVTGRHRERYLQGQLTSDVAALAVGEGQPSAHLDPAGRLQAFCFLAKREDRIDILVPEDVAEHLVNCLGERIIADDVVIELTSRTSRELLLGAEAMRQALTYDDPQLFPVTGWGLKGFVTFADIDSQLPVISSSELEVLAVLGGPPEWGSELRPGMLVNETALMSDAVSLDKGCYLGQETVAKVASRRGAARGPVLLEVEDRAANITDLVGASFAAGELECAGSVFAVATWDGGSWLRASLHRDLRVFGRKIEIRPEIGGRLRVTARPPYLLIAPTRAELAEELVAAASTAFAGGEEDRAEVLLERAVAVCPDHADALESLGVLHGRRGRYEEAISMMKRLLEVDPESVMAHTNMSLWYNRLGRIAEAEEHARQAARQTLRRDNPPNVAPSAEDARRADVERRLDMFRRVLELDPEDPLGNFGTGELLVGEERWAEAVGFLERALASKPDHSAAHLALGRALEGLGDHERAIEVFRGGVAVAARRGDLMTANTMQSRLNALLAAG